MFNMSPLLAVITLSAMSWLAVDAVIDLVHVNTLYLPYQLEPEEYGFGMGAAEKGAIDENNFYIYTVGRNMLHVVDYTNTEFGILNREHTELMPGDVEGADVTTCGTWVAVSAPDLSVPSQGKVFIYDTYVQGSNAMTLRQTLTVGNRPDMLTFTNDCSKLLVAIEATAYVDSANDVIDDEGEVVIVTFSPDPSGSASVTRADFTAFNPLASEYEARGVRWVLQESNCGTPCAGITFSQDLEPEYIAFNKEETIAYVVLQENNAVATLDMVSQTFIDIYPLGEKAFKDSGLDASDRDVGINIQPWDVYGIYQPDGFKYVTFNGRNFLLTANEGDQKELGGDINWAEAQRGDDFVKNDQIGPEVSADLAASLSDDTELGRLDLSTVDHRIDGTDQFNKFVTYGTRSFSLFEVNPDFSVGNLFYDSGRELESAIGNTFSPVFNSNNNDAAETPEISRDSRSDRSGPEPESVDAGRVGDVDVIFVGLERPGFLALYSVDAVTSVPQFESIHYFGGNGDTYENLYNDGRTWDLDPEGIRFIPVERSPTSSPLLSVFSPVTSTVSVYEVVGTPSKQT